MSKKSKMKSVQFKRLLPEIYEKLIIEQYTHTEVSKWLKEKHGLDLLGKAQDGKPFSNYLSIYGAIKTAKESYAGNIENKEFIARHWYNKFTDADTTKTTKPVDKPALESEIHEEPQKPQAVEVPVSPEKSLRLADQYRDPKPAQLSVDDVLSDFNPKL